MSRTNEAAPIAPLPVLHRITDGVSAIDTAWRYTYVNRAAAARAGRAPSELIGRCVWDIFPDAVHLPIHAEAQRAMRDQVAVHLEEYSPAQGRWLEIDLYPSPDGLTIVSRDVTERVRADETIRFQAQLLSAIGQAVIATDLHGRITYWNRAAEALYGWAADAVLGRNVLEVTPSEQTRAQAEEIMARLREGDSWSGEFLVQRRDGTTFPALVVNAPIRDADGRLVGVIGVSTDLSERERAEQALRESEERFRAIAETANEGIWLIDWEAHTLFANRRMADLLGTTVEALSGHTVLDYCFPEDRAMAQERIGKNLEGEPEQFDFRFRRADGAPVQMLAATAGVRDAAGRIVGALGMFTDITARKAAEAALVRQLGLLETISDNAKLSLFLIDNRHHCTVMNPAAERMTGYTLAEVQGKSLHDSVHHTRPDGSAYPLAECPIQQALPMRSRLEGEEVWVRKDGTFYPVAFTASPILEDGAPVGTVLEVADISEQKRAEAERAALLATEQAARETAEVAVRLRDRVLASVTHDLRSPLTTLRGTAQLLQRQARRAELGDHSWLVEGLAIIESTTRRMAAILDELLDVARLQIGQPLELRRAPTDLLALTRAAATVHQEATDRHEVRVVTTLAELTGEWDATRLERVFDNLLSNAIKYSPEGGAVTVTLAAERAGERDWAVLTVSDDGIGIPAADLPHIFERFRRGANVSGAIVGSGLGLAGAKHIVEQHGGTVTLESTEGVGTTVTVRLPLS